MDIRLLDVAQTELDEAVVYYNSQSSGLGDQFLLEFVAALRRIQQFPESWHPFTHNTRRCRTRKFPFGIIYQFSEDEVLVIAVAELHKASGYWSQRLERN